MNLVISEPALRPTIQVDAETPESWGNIVKLFADASIYQTWQYGAVRWGRRSLSHLVLRLDGRVVAAAQLRIAKLPVFSAGVAYLRWGPLARLKETRFDRAIMSMMIDALRREYVDRRRLTLQIIPGVFEEDEGAAVVESALTLAGMLPTPSLGEDRTVLVDLTAPADFIRKSLDKKWRNQLTGSEKNGLVVERSDGVESFREFRRLYDEMWARKRFSTSVNVGEFEQIQEHLSREFRMQTFLARVTGEAVGALVCSHMGDRAIYLLGATNEKARQLKAAYILQWQAMLWLKAQGARSYDLGGVDPVANPGGYHFKRGFGGREVKRIMPHIYNGNALSRKVAAFATWHKNQRSSRP